MLGKELYQIAKKHLKEGGAKFRKFCGLSGSAPWCNAYVCYIFNEGGQAKLYYGGKKVTYCPTSIKWCQANLAQIPLYLAMPMDVIYFDWNNNNVPDHIGFVKAKDNTSEIFTHEGNTNGGIVAEKSRPAKYVMGVFRPHFAPTGLKKEKLAVDGDFGYKSIYMLQTMLGCTADGILGKQTVKKWQAYLGVAQDGAWGRKTTLAAQKILKVKQDGAFGAQSVKALQTYINNKVFPSSTVGTSKPTTTKPTTSKPTTSTTNAQKIIAEINKIAWKYGTAKKKYAYSTGSPTSACRTAMNKHGFKSKINLSDCGNYVTTVVRESGVDKSFKALGAVKSAFPSCGSKFSVVWSGKAIPSGFLKAGDIIRYKKVDSKGKVYAQHAMFYYGNGRVSDAGRENRFGNIRADEKRYTKSYVKKSSIQVLRAK